LAPDVAYNAEDFLMGFGTRERILAVAEHSEIYRPAAVLVPLIAYDGEVTVLLTQRTAHLPDHGGQISFPGGRLEEDDADAVDAALREAEEEVGLAAEKVTVLGAMEQRGTISNYRVTPIVALAEPFRPIPQVEEVAHVFEVPLSFVLDSGNHQFMERGRDGRSDPTYSIPYEEWFIFGFTARILIRLAQIWHGERSLIVPTNS
jgi:8-oxo-dGTP pyrophosphatase MutT (NUDIX family)